METKKIYKLSFGEWVILVGGVLSVGASHARIGVNTKGVEANKATIKAEVERVRKYSYDRTYEAKREIKLLRDEFRGDHDSIVELKTDMKHILREQEKTNKLLEQLNNKK